MRYFALAILLLSLSACASSGLKQAEVRRISADELANLIPAIATISLEDIIAMSKAGKSSDEIIQKIKTSNSRYDLSTEKTLALSQQGVSTTVLTYINESNALAKQNAIADEMNKRDKERAEAENKLRRERDLANQRYYDPFFAPGFGAYYGRPYYGPIGPGARYWRGSRFGWGLNYGYPFGW